MHRRIHRKLIYERIRPKHFIAVFFLLLIAVVGTLAITTYGEAVSQFFAR